MWSAGLSLIIWVLGLFGIGNKKDERDVERKAGEDLGVQKTENANAKAGLNEVQDAVAAREEDRAANAADPGRLRDPANPAAATYRPGPD